MRKITTSLLLSAAVLQAEASTFQWGQEISGAPDTGVGTRFATSTVAISLPLERADRGTESLTSDVSLELTEFRWEGANAAEGEYIWLSVPIKYRQKRTGSTEFHLMAEPGVMTDLDAVGTENLNLNVEISGRTYTGRTTFWQYGILVDRKFGDRKPRPLLALATKLTSDTEMWLGFPKSNIQTRWSQEFSTYARFYPDGGYWKEEVDGLTPAKVTTVSYTNWRMGVGAEFRWRNGVWLNAEVGQLRNRTIRATDNTGVEVSADPAENGYWQLGASLRF